MKKGIYTLANDVVIDQLIALLNSIDENYDPNIPVVIIPYDDRIDLVRGEADRREAVSVFDDPGSIRRWESFAGKVWGPTGGDSGISFGRHALTIHRKLCVIDGSFERFIFLDADTLVMDDLGPVFDMLEDHDIVTYDYQFKDPSHVFNVSYPGLLEVFSKEKLLEIFCVGFFASGKDKFPVDIESRILKRLDADGRGVLYPRAPEQSLLNYMVLAMGIENYNLGRILGPGRRTGNCVTSKHFEEQDGVLYDKGNRLTYLHYIGVPSSDVAELCRGKDKEFPYREIFLKYRFLREKNKMPVLKPGGSGILGRLRKRTRDRRDGHDSAY